MLPRFGQPGAPTPSQLLATLSAQKDLFPVLEQLLNILRRGTDPPVQSLLSPSQQPSKRRKLSRVPAGAADWDIPFPFPPGEGPPNYKEEWTNERCERLISDFINLLREGANKATTRASAKRATSQPVPQSPTRSRQTSARLSLPPTSGNRRSPSSNYVPLPLDAYLRPTVPHGYSVLPPTPATAQSPELGADLLTSMFGAVLPSQGDHLSSSDLFGPCMDPASPEFDLDPLLLSLMGICPSQEGPSGVGSPTPFPEEDSTPALSHSPCPSQSFTSGPSPMTPNFDPPFAVHSPSPSGSTVNRQDLVENFGAAPHLRPQGGMELGMDVDDGFSRVFGIEADVPREPSVANQPQHLCNLPDMVLPTFPGLEPVPKAPGITSQATSSENTPAQSISSPPSMFPQGASDISMFVSRQHPTLSSSSSQPPIFETASLQRQRPVPKRPTPPTPPSKSKAAATLAIAKKRREDALQQARDLRRRLSVDIGKSKVQLWELTMEQGVLARMSKDERLKRS